MINIIKGDLFDINVDAYVQGCNTLGKMNAGIAQQFKENYPIMFEEYRQWCNTGLFNLGDIMFYHSQDSELPHVINLATQDNLKKAEPKALDLAFKKLSQNHNNYPIKSIAMPEIGVGLGNLEKEIFYDLLNKHFGKHALKLFVATL